ncbi:MAG: glycoside hydrolase family 38 C-terminal domain-containing protein, partial [Phycisphaerae bacterium]
MTRQDTRPAGEDFITAFHDRRHWLDRIEAELAFAEALKDLASPGRTRGWTKRIAEARDIVARSASAGKLDRLARAVRNAEETLAPIGKVAKTYNIHLVAHAHIDMNWQWGWAETVATTNDTFSTMLNLMDEFDDLCFTQDQASVYEIARRFCPQVYQRMTRRIAEGRWEVSAAHWVEGDKNIVSGEAIARHLLYSRRAMAEQFGLCPDDVPLDWEPDTFGHAATVPMIVSRGGIRRYYLCRGGKFPKPAVFWWKGPDGSRVLVNREITWYNDKIGFNTARALVRFCRETGLNDWMFVFGIGDHGGGPTRRDILRAREMDTWPIYPNFRFSTTEPYYRILEDNGDRWETLEGELNFEFPGCYTSQSRIKRTNRTAEVLCGQAEAAAALAWASSDLPYPRAELRDAWVRTIFGHFHDILPGSGVAETRDFHLGEFQHIEAACGSARTAALRSLAGEIDTTFAGPVRHEHDANLWFRNATGGGTGAGIARSAAGVSTGPHAVDWPRVTVAFNTTGAPRKEVAIVDMWESGFWPEIRNMETQSFIARLPDGTVLPAQRVGNGTWLAHRYVTVAVPVDVPAMGHAAVAIEPAGEFDVGLPDGYPPRPMTPEVEGFVPGVTAGADFLENETIRAEFDPLTGGVKRLLHKPSGRELANPADPTAMVEYVLERAGGMTSWAVHPLRSRKRSLEVTRFGPAPVPGRFLNTPASGPHVAVLQATIPVERSLVDVSYVLAANSTMLQVHLKVRWLEAGNAEAGIPGLRLRVSHAIDGATARYHVPFGHVDRDCPGQTVPAVGWAELRGKAPDGNKAGLAVLNHGQHGHLVEDDGSMVVSLLRSSYDPDPLPELGDHEMRLALVPHDGSMTPADLTRLSGQFAAPLETVAAPVQEGRLPAT